MWIVAAAIGAIVLIGGGVYIWKVRSSQNTLSPGEAVKTNASPTPAPFDLMTWTDDAGFSFQYPKELSVNKHTEDNDNYAHVELTNKDHPGKIIVWVSDLPAGVTTLDSWVKKLYQGATVIDTKLGGEPAKKILATAPVKTLSVGTISDDLLFNVEGTLTDSDYWQRVHDTIVSSFTFTDSGQPAQADGAGASSGDSPDETEVLQ